jgi:tetratricopeptide (TPR) repeat protein
MTLLIPDAPVAAYTADLDRLGRSALGDGDVGWLALAQVLWRAAQLRADARDTFLHDGATALEAYDADGLVRRAAGAIRRLSHGGPQGSRIEAADEVAAAAQDVVADEEKAGAFTLALATLAALRGAVRSMSARADGLVLAQQGRVARQLGDLPSAEAFYASAAAAGRRAGAPDVRLRALLGRGVAANMRGNYPEARTIFRRALALARRTGAAEYVRAAHSGLLHAALSASDVPTALVHGWAAAQGAADVPAERAMILNNLGEVCRLAGHDRAALRGHLAALALTDLPRIRLAALGGAALAAARLGATGLLAHLARDAERAIEVSGQPYENALTLVELAEAFGVVGDRVASERLRTCAATLAAVGGFHEVTHRVAGLSAREREAERGTTLAHGTRADQGRSNSPRSRAVVRAIEALPGPADFLALAGQYQG